MDEAKVEQIKQTTETKSSNNEENMKPEWQEQLEGMMKNAYLSGVSKGGKTFIGVIYEHIQEYEKKKMNPAKIIMCIKADCCKMLGTLSTTNENKEEKTGV